MVVDSAKVARCSSKLIEAQFNYGQEKLDVCKSPVCLFCQYTLITVQEDVIIYSNATLLGAKAVIGARSIIGGNVWIIESVPPDTKVLLERPKLVYIGKNKKK